MINQGVKIGDDTSETLSSNGGPNYKKDVPSFYLDDKTFFEKHKYKIIGGGALFVLILIIILASGGSDDHITPFGPGDKKFKLSKASLNIEFAEFTEVQNSSNVWVENMAANHNYFFV